MQNGFQYFCRTNAGQWLWVAALVCLAAGCGPAAKSPLPPSAPPPAMAAAPPALAGHWIGKTRLASDTNAAYLMDLWKMPESAGLEAQTLEKLAAALPALLGFSLTNGSSNLAPVILPLLEDLVREESFFELRAPTNQAPEFALALRLPAERTALWNTNLAALVAAFTGATITPTAAPAVGWSARRTQPPATLMFVPVGAWTVLGFGPEAGPLFADFVRRFGSTNAPLAATNDYWVELDADLEHFFSGSFSGATRSLPSLHLTLAGDGRNVHTRGGLTFPQPFPADLGPWNIPTNLIHDPLISFTAMRGIQPWLESARLWQQLQVGAPPQQLYFWGVNGLPFETYFAAAWPDSSNRFNQLSRRFMDHMNAALTNDWGEVTPMLDANGIFWTCNPFLKAFLRHDLEPSGEVVSGGFFQLAPNGRPIPPELTSQFISQTNLLYYDWELTEARIFSWIQVPSFLRMVTGKAQLGTETAGLKWLLAVMPKLGNAGTTIQLVDPHHLAISRTSGVGFTGIELQLLMDWLESPTFPRGLHTFEAPVKIRGKKRTAVGASTNAPSVPAPPAGDGVR